MNTYWIRYSLNKKENKPWKMSQEENIQIPSNCLPILKFKYIVKKNLVLYFSNNTIPFIVYKLLSGIL